MHTAERSTPDSSYIHPTFIQHQKVYEFCQKYCVGKIVLDLGCGEGHGSNLLARTAQRVVGIDSNKSTIGSARNQHRTPNLEFLQQDLNSPSQLGQFDVIISLQVIEHIPNTSTYFGFIKSHLSKSGAVILSTPNKNTQGYNENPFHIREYTTSELKAEAKTHFKSVRVFGLHGDKLVNRFESQRKASVLKALSYDRFRLRRFLPRRATQILFSLMSAVVRQPLVNSETLSISSKNFFINSRTRGSLDLIAVCV